MVDKSAPVTKRAAIVINVLHVSQPRDEAGVDSGVVTIPAGCTRVSRLVNACEGSSPPCSSRVHMHTHCKPAARRARRRPEAIPSTLIAEHAHCEPTAHECDTVKAGSGNVPSF